MASALQDVTLVELRRFVDRMWQGSRVQVLLYGNLYRQEALKLATLIGHKLHEVEDEEGSLEMPAARIAKLNEGVFRYHLPVDHKDVAAFFYLQAQGQSVADRAHMMLMRQMLRSPFFHELRTEKQLGYIVFVTSMNLKDVSGNVFVVQSPSASLQLVTEEIQGFLVGRNREAGSFEQHKQAVLASLREDPKNMPEQSARYWAEIMANNREFQRRSDLIEAVEAITVESLASYLESSFSGLKGAWLTAGEAGASGVEGFPEPESTLNTLKERLPWADLSKFETNPRVQDFGNLLTVNDLCRYIQSKLS